MSTQNEPWITVEEFVILDYLNIALDKSPRVTVERIIENTRIDDKKVLSKALSLLHKDGFVEFDGIRASPLDGSYGISPKGQVVLHRMYHDETILNKLTFQSLQRHYPVTAFNHRFDSAYAVIQRVNIKQKAYTQ